MSKFDKTLIRMNDIKYKLNHAEKISNKLCIKISDYEDTHEDDMAEIVIDVEEFRTMAACLQVLYCNEETIRTALTQAAEIERGNKVVVPREPTERMCDAGDSYTAKAFAKGFETDAEALYKAMITASEGK